jgi:putative PIN family toxin of toxin-antitoxin system
LIRAVLDTNVIVSGVIGRHGRAPPAAIVDAWRLGRFEVTASRHIVAELARALESSRLVSYTTREVRSAIVSLLAEHAVIVEEMANVSGVATHPEDDRVLATAVSARADYLVTGDRQLLALGSLQGVRIVSPTDFLAVLSTAEADVD